MLLKPTRLVKHKGGEIFEADSPEFEIIAKWIAAGAPGPSDADPRIERIEIDPPQVTLENDSTCQVKVTAHFDDGSNKDVTEWAKYTSADETVARVDSLGQVSIVGSGSGAITAWYLSRIAIARVTVPFPNKPNLNFLPRRPSATSLMGPCSTSSGHSTSPILGHSMNFFIYYFPLVLSSFFLAI